jgi:hypothetical protein
MTSICTVNSACSKTRDQLITHLVVTIEESLSGVVSLRNRSLVEQAIDEADVGGCGRLQDINI